MLEQDALLQEYLKVNKAYAPAAIPGTGTFTFLSQLSGIPQIWTQGKDGIPIRYVETADRAMSVHHSPDGTQTVIGVDQKGNEKQQLHLYDNDRQQLEPLVVSPDHFHYCCGWSPDGSHLCYSSNRRHPGHFDVFIVDAESKEETLVFKCDAYCIPLGWADEGALFVSVKMTNIDSELYLVDVHSGQAEKVGRDGMDARYAMPVMASGTKQGYVLTDFGEDTMYLCEFSRDRPDHLRKLLHWEKWDIEEIALCPGEETLAFSLNEGGITRLGIYSIETRECTFVDQVPPGVAEHFSWLSEEEFVFGLKTPIHPGDIWKCLVKENRVERMTELGHSNDAGTFWIEPQLHAYKSFDGLEIPYFLYNQTQTSGQPAVIWVHGGPESQLKAEYNPFIQYLVHKGFAVAAPNIRGSNGYGRRYLQLDDQDRRLDAVADLAALAGELVDRHDAAIDRIGIIGRSYGGFMVLSALTQYPDLWAAGVDIVGMSNLRTFLENTGEWRRYLRECEYGSLTEHREFFEQTAPMNLTDRIQAPLLVFHGRNDTRVPVSEAEQLEADLKRRGAEVELIVFENEGHQTERIENHLTLNTKSVEFFDYHLNSNQPEGAVPS